MTNTRKRKLLLALALVLAGVLLGVGLRGMFRPRGAPPLDSGPSVPQASVWTCSMHPQIRLDHPGKCPICGMDLVPVVEQSGREAPLTSEVHALDPHARAMARVESLPLEYRIVERDLRTVGKVQLDETAIAYITARIDGRVDLVFADFPGIPVNQGDHLVSIYSPDLYATQREHLVNLQAERQRPPDTSGPPPSAASRQRLLLWGITPEQVDALERRRELLTHLTVYAPMGGTITEKSIYAGQYVKTGDALYTIADLDRVWVVLEVYERELTWVRFGQPVEVTLESEPQLPVVGAVGFIEPVLNEQTRTVRVRVMLRNEGGRFKPGMFVQARLRVPLEPNGQPGPTGVEGRFVCPMHPYVVQDGPGACPICGMDLEQVPGRSTPPTPILAVPSEAVLTTGQRQLVYVEEEPGVYRLAQPTLGPRAGDVYPVLSGLEEGDRVVVRGNFLIDSQFQISGKPSLLYPQGIRGGGAGHAGHGGMPGMPADGGGPEGPPAVPPRGHEGHEAPPPPPRDQGPEGHQGHGGG